MEADLSKRCAAELLGTAFLVFIGTGIVVTALLLVQGQVAPPGNTYNKGLDIAAWFVLGLAFGVPIMIMVYVFGNISGTHINPAVTVALWATKRFPTKDSIAYIVAQLIGAAIGSLAVVAVWGTRAVDVGLGATTMFPGVSYWQATLIEVILTFLLMIAIMATAVDKRAPQGWAGLVIGAAATIALTVNGNVTGGSLNPARTFGPYLVDVLMGGANYWWQYPIYLIGPIVGALLAAFLYDYIAEPKRAETRDAPGDRKKHM
jgi:glycerol uptake facilitator protein